MTTALETTVLTVDGLIESMGRDVDVVHMQANGLSHADSLLQPTPRGNCFNWVVGHMLVFRSYMHVALGTEPAYAVPDPERYGYGSEPITEDGDGVVPFADLLATLTASQEQLARDIAAASPESFAAKTRRSNDRTLGADLHFLMWHEAYHAGQTELLRQLAGTNDKLV